MRTKVYVVVMACLIAMALSCREDPASPKLEDTHYSLAIHGPDTLVIGQENDYTVTLVNGQGDSAVIDSFFWQIICVSDDKPRILAHNEEYPHGTVGSLNGSFDSVSLYRDKYGRVDYYIDSAYVFTAYLSVSAVTDTGGLEQVTCKKITVEIPCLHCGCPCTIPYAEMVHSDTIIIRNNEFTQRAVFLAVNSPARSLRWEQGLFHSHGVFMVKDSIVPIDYDSGGYDYTWNARFYPLPRGKAWLKDNNGSILGYASVQFTNEAGDSYYACTDLRIADTSIEE